MSTVPGPQSWRDAGLVGPALTDLPELDAERAVDALADHRPSDAGPGGVEPAEPEPEEYEPPDPRPDLLGAADEGDVAEQLAEVPADEDDDYP
ncbi:hypothetical protein [Cellulomonas hominis]